MTAVTLTDQPKSVRNRCVIEVFNGVCVLSFGFRIFYWYRGFCHGTKSDLFSSFSLFMYEECPLYNYVLVHTFVIHVFVFIVLTFVFIQ